MKNHAAVTQALFAFTHRATASREDRINRVVELAEWELFSNRQISTFTGMRRQDIAAYTSKTTHEGGNLTGESLGPILKLVELAGRDEIDDNEVARASRAGASTRMISKLTGISQSMIARQLRRAA